MMRIVALIAVVLLASATSLLADAPAGRYAVEGGVVLDTKTGLRWQQMVSSPATKWTGALRYCKALSLGGFTSGWRVPSMKELRTLVDESRYNPAIDTTTFPGVASAGSPGSPATFFWSSTPVATFPIMAWYVDFYAGSAGHGVIDTKDAAGNTNLVRCVR